MLQLRLAKTATCFPDWNPASSPGLRCNILYDFNAKFLSSAGMRTMFVTCMGVAWQRKRKPSAVSRPSPTCCPFHCGHVVRLLSWRRWAVCLGTVKKLEVAGSTQWSSVASPQTWHSADLALQGFGAISVQVPLGGACLTSSRILAAVRKWARSHTHNYLNFSVVYLFLLLNRTTRRSPVILPYFARCDVSLTSTRYNTLRSNLSD